MTEQGLALIERVLPALSELNSALETASGTAEKPAGLLRLHVPVNAAKLILPKILPGFLSLYPEVQVEILADSALVDVLAVGCDAGIRYDDDLELDMIAVPIGPRRQRFATVASPAYLKTHGFPEHPKDLEKHLCLRDKSPTGKVAPWKFEKGSEKFQIEPRGSLAYSRGTAVDLGVSAAISGIGILHLFEEWVKPHIESGELQPILEPWWRDFSGPFLYYSGRRLLPPALRAFVDFVKTSSDRWPV